MTDTFKAMLAANMVEAQWSRGRKNKEIIKYINDPEWVAGEKIDGHRVLVVKSGTAVRYLNRGGDTRQHPTPKALGDLVSVLPFDGVIDGELLDGVFHAFDLPSVTFNGDTLISPLTPYQERYDLLANVIERWQPAGKGVRLVPNAVTTAEKIALLEWAERESREGVMFKRTSGRYRPGVRSPDCLKWKFIDDADCVVIDVGFGGRSNLVLGAYRRKGDPKPVEIGHCTALAGNGHLAKPGDVVTVQYAHFSKGERLVQPTRPRIRTDKAAVDCTFDQFRRAWGK